MRLGHNAGFRTDLHADQTEAAFFFLLLGIAGNRLQILIKDLMLEVGQRLEAREGLI